MPRQGCRRRGECVEVDGGLDACVGHEGVAVERGEPGDWIGRRNAHTAGAPAGPHRKGVAQLARQALGPESFVRVMPFAVDDERRAPRSTGLAAAQWGPDRRGPLKLRGDDGVDMAGLMAAGVGCSRGESVQPAT
jgi:hypothetical protein